MTQLFENTEIALTTEEYYALLPAYMQLNEFAYSESATLFVTTYADLLALGTVQVESTSRFSYILTGRTELLAGDIDLESFMKIGEPGSEREVSVSLPPVEQFALVSQKQWETGVLYAIDGVGSDRTAYEDLAARISTHGGALVVFYPDPLPADDA